MKKENLFQWGLEQLELELTETQIKQFEQYYEMLVEKNKVMNLTAITEWDEVVLKHFIDSLAICKFMDVTKPLKVLDMGTGAGFPGIPLKIAFPNLEIVLMDSLNKRIKFLDEVIEALGLEKITAVHSRAEDFQKLGQNREAYDLCVSRAVANLASLSEYCLPYVKVGGYFTPYKSGHIEQEVKEANKAFKILGGKLEAVESFCLPGTDVSRSFVKIKKCINTPKKYPRNAGKPTKEPLV